MKYHSTTSIILLLIFPALITSCMSNGGNTPPRIPRPPHGLSDKEPGSQAYDQDAFLGHDQAEEFNTLPLEESKRNLALLVKKIDTNGDEAVSNSELIVWINKTHIRYITSTSDIHFTDLDNDFDGLVSWTEYDSKTYGFVDSELYEIEDEQHQELGYLRARDERRWKVADTDSDGSLTNTEFRAFIYPEEFTHTRPNYARETMNQIDMDKDQYVNFEEYINDLLTEKDQNGHPDWVDAEELRFKEVRDANGDGKLDLDEVTAWLFPLFSEVESEATHLISMSDQNMDGELDLKEILNNHDLFAGSKATEWGEALKSEL